MAVEGLEISALCTTHRCHHLQSVETSRKPLPTDCVDIVRTRVADTATRSDRTRPSQSCVVEISVVCPPDPCQLLCRLLTAAVRLPYVHTTPVTQPDSFHCGVKLNLVVPVTGSGGWWDWKFLHFAPDKSLPPPSLDIW